MNPLMQVITQFHFLRPTWLWALLAIPVLWWLWELGQRRANVWRGLIDAHLLEHLQVGGARIRRQSLIGLVLAWVIATLALAGPSWKQETVPLWKGDAPLVIALDLSTAITADDLPPSRLLQARAKLSALLRERVGGQVALVVYTNQAFTVAPLTDDAANVALFLDALSPQVMPQDGSDASSAIEWSQAMLYRAGFKYGQILLVTDHADSRANAAATRAQKAGFSVSALGLGTSAGAKYVKGYQRGYDYAKLDAASLQQLADAGGGSYQPLRPDDADLKALGVLNPPTENDGRKEDADSRIWLDQGYWLLLPLMLLCLFAFRRGGVLAVLMLCAIVPIAQPAQAVDWFSRPDQKAQVKIERGAQAYREGDFAAAAEEFSELSSVDGVYNRGNALAQKGDYEQAIEAYDAALKLQPNMDDAIFNRAAVEAALKQQQQSQQNQQSQDQGQQGQQGQSENNQNEQSQSQNQQQGKTDASDQPNPSEPAEGQQNDQQTADEAQQQRMQQAMEQQEDASQQAQNQPAQLAQETQAQQEQRLADEALLQRIQDDPGGLLRNKFRIEYQRRQREENHVQE